MKTEVKRILFLSQTPAIVFFLVYLVGKILLKNHYELFLFGSTCLITVSYICFSVFLVIEFIAVLVLAIKTKKLLLIILNIILLTVLFLQSLAIDLNINTLSSAKEYAFEQFETDIVIENSSFLLSGTSTIYEKNNRFLLQKIASVSGDDGYCPLEDESKFNITLYNNQITFIYYFDSSANPATTTKELTIIYDSGHFKAK